MTTDQKIIKNKLGLLGLAETLGNVSQACKLMGYSRDRFYRCKELYDTGGELALREMCYAPLRDQPSEADPRQSGRSCPRGGRGPVRF